MSVLIVEVSSHSHISRERGTSAFNTDPSYKVFRNVKDYGAVGDGITDDTDAIKSVLFNLSGRRLALSLVRFQ